MTTSARWRRTPTDALVCRVREPVGPHPRRRRRRRPATSFDFWTWHFIEEGWDYGFVEALVGGEWVTVPLVDDSGTVVTTERRPARQQHRRATGITGTSGGEYFVDEPHVHTPG